MKRLRCLQYVPKAVRLQWHAEKMRHDNAPQIARRASMRRVWADRREGK